MVATHVARPSTRLPGVPPRAQPAPTSPARPHRARTVRATAARRQRVALLALLLVLGVVAVACLRAVAAMGDVGGSGRPEPIDGPVAVAGRHYVVQPGDTLWSIASRVAPRQDPRLVVDALRHANGGAALEPGARLVIVAPGA